MCERPHTGDFPKLMRLWEKTSEVRILPPNNSRIVGTLLMLYVHTLLLTDCTLLRLWVDRLKRHQKWTKMTFVSSWVLTMGLSTQALKLGSLNPDPHGTQTKRMHCWTHCQAVQHGSGSEWSLDLDPRSASDPNPILVWRAPIGYMIPFAQF